MERCPLCRARLKGQFVCGRCQSDLRLPLEIESQAQILSRRAVKALLAGEMQAAGEQAAAAERLHATPFHRALAGFIKEMEAK